MNNANAVLASTTIAMSRCGLAQLGGHLWPGDLDFSAI